MWRLTSIMTARDKTAQRGHGTGQERGLRRILASVFTAFWSHRWLQFSRGGLTLSLSCGNERRQCCTMWHFKWTLTDYCSDGKSERWHGYNDDDQGEAFCVIKQKGGDERTRDIKVSHTCCSTLSPMSFTHLLLHLLLSTQLHLIQNCDLHENL